MPGYSNMAPKMESNKQERSNLLHDNPVARDASGGRPWISKHFFQNIFNHQCHH